MAVGGGIRWLAGAMINSADFSNTADWIAGACLFLAIVVGVGMAVSAWKNRR